jgi:tRNA (guanine-N7-)-methyltransferase
MSRKKSVRVAQLGQMAHVFVRPQEPDALALSDFATGKSLVLDIGCGSGDTTVAMAAADPGRHYLGVDLKGARLHRGAEAAARLRLTNVAFAVISILDLPQLLPEHACVEAWLFFPDPFLKRRAAKHRLTSPAYLSAYRRLLRAGARLHLRTDSRALFEYSQKSLKEAGFTVCQAVTLRPPYDESGPWPEVPSRYESRFRKEGRDLHGLIFQVP